MKKTCLLLIALLLLSSITPGVTPVMAAGEIEIQSYSVAGVLNVPNVYAVTLTLRWIGVGDERKLTNLSVATPTGTSFVTANTDGSSYTIAPSGVNVYSGELGRNGTLAKTIYVVKVGSTDALALKFSYQCPGVLPADPPVTGTCDSTITIVKTTPDPQPYTPTDPGTPDTSKYKPVIGVASDAALPLIDQDTTILSIPIHNGGNYAASKITIQLEPADKSKPIVIANRMSASATISSLSTNTTKYAQFNVSLAPSAPSGIQPVVLNYSYQNSYGDSFTGTETAYIQVENQNAAPRLSVTGGTSNLQPGAESLVSLVVQNNGLNAARNVKITLLGLTAGGISVMRDVDVKFLDRVEGMSGRSVEYNLYTATSIADPTALLQVKLDFTDISGTSYSETNSIFLPVMNGGGTGKGTPRLIISQYSCHPQEIRTGSQFVLNMVLQNTSRSKAITNLKVTVLSDDGVFLPVNASNTMFIEEILANDLVSVSLPLATKTDAENKPYSLRITFDYESASGDPYNSQEVISIPVRQNPRLVVNDPVVNGEAMAYQMVPISVEFYNMGKTILYNLMVKGEGSFQMEGGSYFVGNFNPGSSESFNFAVIPSEPGTQVGAVVFSYEDAAGTQLEERREFTLNVMPPFVPEDPGMGKPMEPERPSVWRYVAIGAGILLVLGGGGGFLWLRRRKRRKVNLLHAEDMIAAATTVVPEIEYVGFDQPDCSPEKTAPTESAESITESDQP